MKLFTYAIIFSILFFITECCRAQTASETATITGTIADKSTGELLGGVVVFLDSSKIGQKGTISDFDGNYKLSGMLVGIFRLRFSAILRCKWQIDDQRKPCSYCWNELDEIQCFKLGQWNLFRAHHQRWKSEHDESFDQQII